jgi:proteasome lid subunit RPN8/RPN11
LEIILTKNQKEELARHAESAVPNESCALLFGNQDGNRVVVSEIFLTENKDKSSIKFSISNEKLLEGYQYAERKGLEVVGIFHSHPLSEAVPSDTDIRFMQINPVVWIIFSNKLQNFEAYILESDVMPVSIKIVES